MVLILRNGDFSDGLNFYTEDKDFVQVSTWNYDKGKKTVPHAHKIFKRTTNKTQEVIFVKTGKMRISIYNEKNNLCKKTILKSGDVAIIFAGGHAYEILESKTQILEVKNGPYPGIKKDKQVII